MTRQEKIEELRSRVVHMNISHFDDLNLEISCAEYDGDEPIEAIDDILMPLSFNICDKCGLLEPSEELCWVDYLDPEYDQDLIDKITAGDEDYCALCYECVKDLRKEGLDNDTK